MFLLHFYTHRLAHLSAGQVCYNENIFEYLWHSLNTRISMITPASFSVFLLHIVTLPLSLEVVISARFHFVPVAEEGRRWPHSVWGKERESLTHRWSPDRQARETWRLSFCYNSRNHHKEQPAGND